MDDERDATNETDGLVAADIMGITAKMGEFHGTTLLFIDPDDVYGIVPQAVAVGPNQTPAYVIAEQFLIALLVAVQDLQMRLVAAEAAIVVLQD